MHTNLICYLVFFWSLAALFAACFFWWKERFPSIEAFQKFIELVNTKGGNILVLLFMSLIGTFASVRFLYYIVQLSVDGKLQQDNSFALLAISFLTNTLTGAFIGAMLKTMTGDAPPVKEIVNEKGTTPTPTPGTPGV